MLLDGASDTEPTDTAPAVEDKEPAGPEIPPPPEPDKPVALTGPPKSRRQRIDEEYTTTVKSLKEGMENITRSLSERDQRIGELTGHVAALSQRQQYAPQPQYQAPQPQLPDPEEMERKALERLDARDMAGYHRFLGEANTARTLRTLAPVLAQRQQQATPQQEQMPPGLMPFFAAYPEVASHPRSMELLASENVRLEALGVPRGPDRVKQIFDNIKSALTANRPTHGAAFSQDSRAALSGVPTPRPTNGGAGGGGPRVDLTTEERIVAKRMGLNDAKMAELVMKNDPGRVIRG